MAKPLFNFEKGAHKMKKVLLSLVLFSLVVSLPAVAQTSLKDVPSNHWAASAVYDVVQLGVVQGYPDGTFRGNRNITRYEAAVMISKLAKVMEGMGGAEGVSEARVKELINRAMANSAAPSDGAGISGTLFVSYVNGLENYPAYNNFGLDRAYITINRQLGANAKAKVVLDSGRISGVTDRMETFLKYAYVDLEDVVPAGAIPGFSLNGRIGMQPTYWSSWVDGIVGLRVVASSLVGLDGGITTSDFGLGAHGTLNIGLPINYIVTALNGSGFAAMENNAAKNLAGRVDTEIMPGIIVGIGGRIADIEPDGDTGGKLANAILAYKSDMIKAYIEGLYGRGGIGGSASGSLNLGMMQDMMSAWGVYGRVDVYDPDRDIKDDHRIRYWAGVSYDWNDNVKLLADYSGVSYMNASLVLPDTTVSQIALRTQINL
jgi:hypothetical protein